jgi:phenazine biosynthesis protein phzE
MIPTGTPFALLRREGRAHVEILTGPVRTVDRLADLPDGLAIVPYRQVRERGFDAIDDGAPLLCLVTETRSTVPVIAALDALPTDPPTVHSGGFDVSDADYAATVERVLADEIGRGDGSNFVIHRVYEATVDGDPLAAALAAYARLLRDERGAYWTFLVHTGDRTFVGATPERHVTVEDGLVSMNPISGTYRHPAGGPDRAGLLRFLADRKEIDELYMVLDEELKMMATVADRGGVVVGPYLKEMAHLTHTEYLLVGRGSKGVRDVLRETMFAPTVVGSPIENACRVVARHERRGRGYYAGVLALIEGETLDAPILIRCATIDADGRLRVPVGATLVRHSTPDGEVAETYAKAAGVMAALGLRSGAACVAPAGFASDPAVRDMLARRNDTLARFWLEERVDTGASLAGRVLIVDAEDRFTDMLAHQLRSLGLAVRLCSYRDRVEDADLVVVGPGPGDPGNRDDPKMAALHDLVARLLAARRPMLAVCLGHQVLAAALGLELHRKDVPYQGVQREIEFFGRRERVGFYSTYAARCATDVFASPYGEVSVSRDAASGDVHALRGETFAGVQFHAESVLTEHGVDILRTLVTPLVYVSSTR